MTSLWRVCLPTFIYFSHHSVLPPPQLEGECDGPEDLKQAIDELSKNYGYAVNIRGFDKDKRGIRNTVYFCCSKGQTVRPGKGSGRPQVGSKRTECPFQAVDKLFDNSWTLALINHERSSMLN